MLLILLPHPYCRQGERLTKGKIDSIRYYYAMARKGLAYISHTKKNAASEEPTMAMMKSCAREKGIQVENFVDDTYIYRYGDRSKLVWTPIEEKASTAWLCSNKYATFEYLKMHGFQHLPRYRRYSLATINEARQDFRTRGNPVVIKPSRHTYGGTGVTANIRTERQLNKAIFNALVYNSDFLMEDFIEGENYRVLCYRDEVLSVSHRTPASVIGDGKSSIRKLIELENERRTTGPDPTKLYPIKIDHELKQTLLNRGLSLNHVPAAGEEVYVRTLSNHQAGGDRRDATDMIHPDVVKDCLEIMRIMDINLGGIDIITKDISKPLAESGGKINEVNTDPGLYGHGRAAVMKVVEGLFEEYLAPESVSEERSSSDQERPAVTTTAIEPAQELGRSQSQ
jgi:cyanophycin synthetase